MSNLLITTGDLRFVGRLERELAPQTCAWFEARLPYSTKFIHVRWSGEACWVPMGEEAMPFGFENATSHPAPGQMIFYPGGSSATEILLAYGGVRFARKLGQLAGTPVVDLDPFSIGFMADPFSAHGARRDAGPYVWLSHYNVGAVARYEQVRAVLMDWKTFSSARGVGMEDFALRGRIRLPSLILEADPPEHTVARGILSGVQSPPVLKSLRETFLQEADLLVSELL